MKSFSNSPHNNLRSGRSHTFPFLHSLFKYLTLASDGANRATEWSLFILGITMAFVTALQVFFRYVLNHSLFWSEELGRSLLVWITFLGASVAYKRKAHIGIDYFVCRLKGKFLYLTRIFTISISVFFFSIMIIYGVKFTSFIRFQKTAALGISKSVPFFVIPFSGSLLLLHALALLLETILYQSEQ